jgi:hypothetical protein
MSATGKHLGAVEREILADLIAKDHLTAGQVAVLFLALAGRSIARATIQRRRRAGAYIDRGGHNHLIRAEREALDRLIGEADGEVGYREMAEQFLALAGRSIHPSAVWHRAMALGVPRVGRGRRRPKLRRISLEARIAGASAAKSGERGTGKPMGGSPR